MSAPNNTMKRAMLLGASALTASALLFSGSAFAQIDEVIVTAQKREENIQDVPISITAMPASEINTILQGGGDILSLANRTPGLYAESSNGRTAPRFYIRGLGNTDFALQATQPVSIIMNDVVMENTLLKSFPLFDVEQIEVLRGPQGTLFGRNTTAGIIKLSSVKPSQETDMRFSTSYGTYGSMNTQVAVGGALSDTLSGRLSGALIRRSDYVDNTFTNEKDALGGFEDLAGRAQLLWTPTEALDVLLDVHARDEEGTATLFRANILTTGSNDVNSNFVKDEVAYDGGAGNPQEINSKGITLNVSYDLGAATLTSITAFEEATGLSRGDIDGGFGAVFLPFMGPGFIPFPSDTGNEYFTNQYTQEIRLASNGDEALKWQLGAFLFRSKMKALTDPGFVPPSILVDHKKAWAIFGQGSYDFNDTTTLTGGIRYTEDKADLSVFNQPGAPVPETKIDASEVSWDISLNHAVNENVNVYGRVARGFRGPSIQGRDVAFFGGVTTAQPETIQSYELGFKSMLADNRLRFNAAAFYYTVKNQQFTAVGGTGNNVGLINSDKGVGYGFEADATWAVNDFLNLTAGFALNETEIKDNTLSVAVCGSGLCTVTDPLNVNGRALVNGNPFPNAPKITANFIADYKAPINDSMNFVASLDGSIQGHTNLFLYESLEYFTSGNFELGGKLGLTFEDDKYELSVFARNLTDEVNIAGGIDFNNNTAFVTEPRIVGVMFSARN
ncbi:MAG: TonB-dependent receptor [Robiginitomaculum sp.]|nr:MAG: TonB-dependent receptor [Robiginitomaculum sp.]